LVNTAIYNLSLILVRQTHTASSFRAQVDADAQEICGASCFTTFATNTVLCTGRGGNLASFTAIPGYHL